MKRNKLNREYLERIEACKRGIKWVETRENKDIGSLFKIVIKSRDVFLLEWGNWLICRLLNKKQRIQYSVYAAEQVIHLIEDEHLGVVNPKEALEAALKCTKSTSQNSKNDAKYAMNSMIGSAKCAGRRSSWVSESAAYAIAWAARTAYTTNTPPIQNSIKSAVEVSFWAFNSATRSGDELNGIEILIKILTYGYKLYTE